MQVIFILSLFLCGYISGLGTVLFIHSIGEFIEERNKIKEEKKEKRAIEIEKTTFENVVKHQYRTTTEKIEELTLRLEAEEEAHKFWRNKWAELNNTNTKGDNE